MPFVFNGKKTAFNKMMKVREFKEPKNQLKLDGKKITMLSLKMNKKYLMQDTTNIINKKSKKEIFTTDNKHNPTTFDFIKELLATRKNKKNEIYHINFEYDNIINYNVNSGFESLDDLKLNSIFEEYEFKEGAVKNIVTGIDIYVANKPKKAGGNDETENTKNYNNCLWNILKTIKPNTFKTPWNFKKFLNLENDEPVPLNLIPQLEKKYKINIIVVNYYDGIGQYQQTITINLTNGHYTKIINKEHKFKFAYFKTDKNIIVCQKRTEKVFYDGDKLTNNYILGHVVQIKPEEDIKEKYNEIKKDYDLLKTLSNNKFNPYRFKNIPDMCLCLINNDKYLKSVTPDIIEADEAIWLKKATGGGLRYAEKGTYKKTYSYDINRFYPFLQINNFKFPTGKPEFKILNTLPTNTKDDYLKLGVYKCFIAPDHPLFHYNYNNLYTNYSIKQAYELNLKVELININKEFNAMIYTDNKKTYSMIKFKSLYDELYLLNSKGCKVAKLIANTMWGVLCSKNKKTYFINEESKKELNLTIHDNILRLGKEWEVEIMDPNQYFKYSFARLGPFLTAKGRYTLSKILKPFYEQDDIIYIHTDGWISKTKLNLKLGDKMGDIRDDIKNNNKFNNGVKIVNKNVLTPL